MTKHDQTKLLESFLASMRDSLMRRVADMPEAWDGFEIRQFVADEFEGEAGFGCLDGRTARGRAYQHAKANIGR